MGGGRGVHGAMAAVATAVLASAAATVDVPEKLHLRATPILFHAVPISMPLPPLSSLSAGSSSAGESSPFSVSFSRALAAKDCAAPPLASTGSLAPPNASAVAARDPHTSLDFSLAQGALGRSEFARRALVPGRVAASSGVARVSPCGFAASGLYSAAVTGKATSASSLPYSAVSWLGKHGDAPSQTQYLESLLSSVQNASAGEPSEALHAWHVSDGGGEEDAVARKPVLTVVLLGWLGAQQKHLKKYAEWYNARGIHAVTFVIPMTDILSFKGQGNAEERVDSLARHLVQWLSDQGEHAAVDGEKQLIFHTFSNTGWLTYGAILEKMEKQGGDLVGRIKGCVVDSAPVPDPDPQVWASGFSAALLKKRSSATKPALLKGEVEEGVTVEASSLGSVANLEVDGANGLEIAVLTVLEQFFSLFLKLPAINQRLSEVVMVLQKKQPPCPQLYIYSTADKVIPVKAVEAFIQEQRKAGRVVRACNLQSSPHVDHFRSHPQLYSEQLINFLKEVLPSTHTQEYTL